MTAHQPTAVIAHSLMSVVTYETLSAHFACRSTY